MHMHRKAFTLVELLVVIAIIALLIAILAPSLKAAKDLAKATYCMTNLNALTKSALVYAEGNRGYMMVYQHSTNNGFIKAPGDTYTSYACFHNAQGIDPKTGLYKDARGLGMVYAAGLLGPAEMFYCPDQKDERMTIGNYPKPWGSATNSGSNFIRNSYMWNPWVAKILGGSDTDWTYEDALMVSRHPSARHLISDIIESEATFSHNTANSARWNLGYIDSHVAPFEDKTLYTTFIEGYTAHNTWDDYNGTDSPKVGVRPYLPGAK